MSALSRKKRILNLALHVNENNGSLPRSCNKDDDTCRKETGCQLYTTISSPVPPGAENIDIDMADVWHNVFDDDNENDSLSGKSDPNIHNPGTYHDTCDQITSPPMDLPPAPPTDEVLTPLNIEAPSSFNNSPAIYIEEFEEPAISTPSSSHMTLATPVPSPVNVHKQCNDPFCADHSGWIDSIQSLNNSTSNLASETAPKRNSKKRLVRRQDWSDVKRKTLKNLGKSYVSKRGRFVSDKMMGKPCSCKYKCGDKMTEEQRLECFNRFWKLGSREKQWMYVAKYVKKAIKNRCLNRSTPNKRQYTFRYFLPLILSSKSETIPIKVCKTMFLQTLAVSESIVKTTFQKYDGVGDVEQDNRG